MDLRVAGERVFAYSGGRVFDPRLPSVVFVHGGAQDHSVWTLHARYLAHHGLGVLAVDLPGHGRSTGAPLATISGMADWIAALLDAASLESATLVGHSMGSLAALDCAGRYTKRVARLAVLGTAFPMRVSPELLQATSSDEPRARRMINAWSHSSLAHYPGNPGPGFSVIEVNLRLMQRQKAGVLHADFAACNAYAQGVVSATQVRCPTLVLLGRRDQMTPARSGRALAQSIAGAKLIEIDDCGHNLMGEKPDEVLSALAGFLGIATVTS